MPEDDAPTPVDAPVVTVLDRLTRLVTDARALPMSASCVVNRQEVLDLLTELRRTLPEVLSRASEVVGQREDVVAGGKAAADELLEKARQEQKAMLSRAEVTKAAREEATRIVDEAKSEAEAMRLEVEEYVDSKLANFEVVLSKTLGAVQRGRARLHGESELDALGDDDVPTRGLAGGGEVARG